MHLLLYITYIIGLIPTYVRYCCYVSSAERVLFRVIWGDFYKVNWMPNSIFERLLGLVHAVV